MCERTLPSLLVLLIFTGELCVSFFSLTFSKTALLFRLYCNAFDENMVN